MVAADVTLLINQITIIARFKLTKSERLKSRKLIEQLFREGKSFSDFPLRMLYLLHNGIFPLQAGFGVSTKNFKKAVERNRVKRLMKEAYRLQKNSLAKKLDHQKKCMAVFFIYTGTTLPKFHEVSGKFYAALNRLEKIADETASSHP